jgi:hypothetical protein
MASFAELFVAGALMTSLFVRGIQSFTNEATMVVSGRDNREYVVRNLSDKQSAADLLADINETVGNFVERLSKDFPDDQRVALVRKRFNPANVSEGSHKTGYTSYSQNKGEKIVVCLRQTDDTFVAKNELMYVVIHELGHLSTNEIGHTPGFWSNFKWLLQRAIDYGLYKYVDYASSPSPYCGISITSSVAS